MMSIETYLESLDTEYIERMKEHRKEAGDGEENYVEKNLITYGLRGLALKYKLGKKRVQAGKLIRYIDYRLKIREILKRIFNSDFINDYEIRKYAIIIAGNIKMKSLLPMVFGLMLREDNKELNGIYEKTLARLKEK